MCRYELQEAGRRFRRAKPDRGDSRTAAEGEPSPSPLRVLGDSRTGGAAAGFRSGATKSLPRGEGFGVGVTCAVLPQRRIE